MFHSNPADQPYQPLALSEGFRHIEIPIQRKKNEQNNTGIKAVILQKLQAIAFGWIAKNIKKVERLESKDELGADSR